MNNQLRKNVSQYLKLSGLSILHCYDYYHYVLQNYPCLNGDSFKKIAVYVVDKPDLRDVCTLKVGSESKQFDELWLVCSNEFNKENWSYSMGKHGVQLYTETEFYFRIMRDISLLSIYNQFPNCSELYTISSFKKISINFKDSKEEELIEANMEKYSNRMQLITDKAAEKFKVIIDPLIEPHFIINGEFPRVSESSLFINEPEIVPISNDTKESLETDIDIEFVLERIDPRKMWLEDKEELYKYKTNQ
ncbi:hypothetical protein [Salimicrobium halophilum]|uniref:Uncharacterized protein n=1 Tax=Salimicrobium halophilum TaxID=86666 RepID=A0A1G8W5R5_9BACI|nr:hypothetical protein [Salimicrobium halophilum]SDJ73427.1 hypothetical protein SAMN04490247_3031 [Salimicrobium halophilum]